MKDIRVRAEVFHESAPIHQSNALTCPDCGTLTDVVDSRPVVLNGFTTVRRRRSCSGCGKRYNTAELQIRDFKRAADLLSQLARFQVVAED